MKIEIEIDDDLYAEIVRVAEEMQISVDQLISNALREYLRQSPITETTSLSSDQEIKP